MWPNSRWTGASHSFGIIATDHFGTGCTAQILFLREYSLNGSGLVEGDCWGVRLVSGVLPEPCPLPCVRQSSYTFDICSHFSITCGLAPSSKRGVTYRVTWKLHKWWFLVTCTDSEGRGRLKKTETEFDPEPRPGSTWCCGNLWVCVWGEALGCACLLLNAGARRVWHKQHLTEVPSEDTWISFFFCSL